ncbi:alpha/beta hydrolase [Aestuariimicrobium kwangyangense]|uniref:alpha/beta hydrolase n=1 Tax=Aestuariimicrobium kwangyangense TaxID=396389 RepID=UPI001FDECF56|nr:alpha/beta hydrolase [Aestuariimicrobium kwangyangense]
MADSYPVADWYPDELLPGYECLRLELHDPAVADGEPEDTDLCATLVRQHPPRHRRAVLYLHGWSDYFFQTHLAEFFDGLGFDFHAIELRRYGRSLREGQLGGFVTDLHEYFDELDEAFAVIAADHDDITLMGHSTGGLTASLWANERPGRFNGVVLNSPWIDLQGAPVLKAVTAPMMKTLGQRYPTTVLPLTDAGIYARSIHASQDGEWDFDLGLKQHPSFAIRVGWMRAIMAGHAEVKAGLHIDTPVISMLSHKTSFRRTYGPLAQTTDTVLDVDKLARGSVRLGPHVTVVRITDGMHDLVLSGERARADVFEHLRRWLSAYVL